jgi:hypothetical protein
MISPSSTEATLAAILVFPEAVGPRMVIRLYFLLCMTLEILETQKYSLKLLILKSNFYS